MRVFAAFGPLLLLPAMAAQGPAAATSATTIYRNDTLHLAYQYPARFVDATAMVTPAFEASVGQDPESAPVAKCLTLPFSRMQPDPKNIGLIVMIRADAGCFKKKFNAKSVTEFAQGEAHGLTASGAKTNLGAPIGFSVANHPASLVEGSFSLPTGQTMQARVVCVLDQPDVVCWQFLAGNPETLSTLGTFPVTFDGSASTPLVPGSVPAHN